MMNIDSRIQAESLGAKITAMWSVSAKKIMTLEKQWDPSKGSPVFTQAGHYVSRGWTEWTQGFQFGSSLLQFEAAGDKTFLEIGRKHTIKNMAGHITHTGVHDHGFNNVSTYGNLWRLMEQGLIPSNIMEKEFYQLAIKASGAVQACRWSPVKAEADSQTELGFIYSFNGPHSLFADTIRSLRALALSHQWGHVLMGEQDEKISLLKRLLQHALTTAKYTVYYGEDRDAYDVNGRVAHESLFNPNNGSYRCPASQQGYSSFTTWTRGLAWVMCGFAEQLEFLHDHRFDRIQGVGDWNSIEEALVKAARAACDFYIRETPTDGIPYWDTGAPNLHRLGDYLSRPADPNNDWEPVDSSAAAIAAQGLLRLGHYLNPEKEGKTYWQAGLTVLNRLLEAPYLSQDENHQGLLLHSIYHRPNNWDYTPSGSKIPKGESSMWGDYHLREVALYVQKIIRSEKYYCFYG